jgi:hypothetical protein
MKNAIILAALLVGVLVASAQDAPPPTKWDEFKKWMPSIPSMRDLSGEFDAFTQQVGESLPLLEEMGYEVSTFRVQWGLPPKAKLRLRAKGTTDPDKIKAIEAKATGGMMMTMLLSSAAAAKRIQSSMKFGTAIIDVDFAVPPKIKMSFLNEKSDTKDPAEREVEDLDLACGQALGGN